MTVQAAVDSMRNAILEFSGNNMYHFIKHGFRLLWSLYPMHTTVF